MKFLISLVLVTAFAGGFKVKTERIHKKDNKIELIGAFETETGTTFVVDACGMQLSLTTKLKTQQDAEDAVKELDKEIKAACK